MATMGINGYAERLPKDITDLEYGRRIATIHNRTHPFSLMTIDMEIKWAKWGTKEWVDGFWRPRVKAVLDNKKTPYIVIGYGLDPNNDGFNVRFQIPELSMVKGIMQLGIDVAIEECINANAPRPIFTFWREPRAVINGVERKDITGFDLQFMDQTQWLIDELKLYGRELVGPALHGPYEKLRANIGWLFQNRRSYRWIDRCDSYSFTYYPGNDQITKMDRFTNQVTNILATFRKYTNRPIDHAEWHWNTGTFPNSAERAENNRLFYNWSKANKDIRYSSFYGLINKDHLW